MTLGTLLLLCRKTGKERFDVDHAKRNPPLSLAVVSLSVARVQGLCKHIDDVASSFCFWNLDADLWLRITHERSWNADQCRSWVVVGTGSVRAQSRQICRFSQKWVKNGVSVTSQKWPQSGFKVGFGFNLTRKTARKPTLDPVLGHFSPIAEKRCLGQRQSIIWQSGPERPHAHYKTFGSWVGFRLMSAVGVQGLGLSFIWA